MKKKTKDSMISIAYDPEQIRKEDVAFQAEQQRAGERLRNLMHGTGEYYKPIPEPTPVPESRRIMWQVGEYLAAIIDCIVPIKNLDSTFRSTVEDSQKELAAIAGRVSAVARGEGFEEVK